MRKVFFAGHVFFFVLVAVIGLLSMDGTAMAISALFMGNIGWGL